MVLKGFFTFFILIAFASADALAEVTVDGGMGLSHFGKSVEFIKDPQGDMTIADVITGPFNWTQNEAKIFNQGYNSAVWWIRFEVTNRSELNDWLLSIEYPVLDFVDIYQVRNGEVLSSWALGDNRPFNDRPLKHRNFVLPLDIEAGASSMVYMRVASGSSVQVPMSLWHKEAFFSQDELITFIHGGFYGALTVIAIYNLLVFFALKEAVYLLYVGYVIFMGLFNASMAGWSYQYLWPEAVQWNNQSLIVFLTLTMVFATAFLSRFLTRMLPKPIDMTHKGTIVISAFFALLAMWVSYANLIVWLVPFAALLGVWGVYIGVYAWWRGIPSARWYTISWAGLLFGVLVIVLSKFALIPRNVLTNNALQLGTLMEVVLLSFALAERISNERSMRLRAQQRALQIQTIARQELETRVKERTAELEVSNQKLQELSDTDQLTGLKNRRFMDGFLDKEIARAFRHQHCLAVMLLDIDHFKQVNDNWGHLVGDDCLQQVANRVKGMMRDTDLVARYGGEEFCIVMLEPDSRKASDVAERIRLAIANEPVETRDGELELTASLGFCVGVPDKKELAAEFLKNADEALYASKNNGRNRVTHIDYSPGSA